MQQGHSADMKHGQASWTCIMDRWHDMQHGCAKWTWHATWTSIMDMKCDMDMQQHCKPSPFDELFFAANTAMVSSYTVSLFKVIIRKYFSQGKCKPLICTLRQNLNFYFVNCLFYFLLSAYAFPDSIWKLLCHLWIYWCVVIFK